AIDQATAPTGDQALCNLRIDPFDEPVEGFGHSECVSGRILERDRPPLWKAGVVDKLGVCIRDLGRGFQPVLGSLVPTRVDETVPEGQWARLVAMADRARGDRS